MLQYGFNTFIQNTTCCFLKLLLFPSIHQNQKTKTTRAQEWTKLPLARVKGICISHIVPSILFTCFVTRLRIIFSKKVQVKKRCICSMESILNGTNRHPKGRSWNMKKVIFISSEILSVSSSHTDGRWYMVIQVTGIKRNFYADMRLGFEDILLLIRFYCNLLDKIFELKIQRVHGILNYLCSTDQSKAFLNWLCQYIFSRCFFFDIFFPVEKCGVISHCLYHDSLT